MIDKEARETGDWVFSPAKVNLYLKITGRRADGYHLLDTLLARLTLGDRLRLTAHENGGRWAVRCPGHPQLENESNLCLRAAEALRPYVAKTEALFEGTIELQKEIPLGAGLGGGSSNAAAVMQMISQRYSMTIGEEQLFALAAKLGGDVPFFLRSGAWILGGIGDEFVRRVTLPPAGLLLIYPGCGVPSAWAYQAYDAQNFPLTWGGANAKGAGPWLTAYDLGKIMENDLEPVVMAKHAEIASARRKMVEIGALAAMMSGSGSTVYGLFDSLPAAQAAAAKLGALPQGWRVFCAEFLAQSNPNARGAGGKR